MVNKKGQAAVFDALIFLTIVGIVASMISLSAINYGNDIFNNAKTNYDQSYLYAGLKALFLSSYGRDGKDVLNSNNADLLMTKVKEDYSEYGKIKTNTQRGLFYTLNRIFLLYPNKGYFLALIVHEGKRDNYIFTGIHTFMTSNDCPGDADVCAIGVDLNCKVNGDLMEFLQKHNNNLKVVMSYLGFYKGLFTQMSPKYFSGSVILGMWDATLDIREEKALNEKVTFDDLECNVVKIYLED